MELTPEQIVPNRPLRVFLCHSSGDKPAVRDLYRRLRTDGFEPWLDEEELLPGQDWHEEIPAAVRACDVVIICLSQKSVSKEGYLQREIRDALYVAEEKPEGTIFIIPVKLEEVEVSRRLSQWQWAKLFGEGGYQRLVRALNVRASAIGAAVAAHEVITGEEAERKAREAEDARLKAEAERKARQEAEARTGRRKDPLPPPSIPFQSGDLCPRRARLWCRPRRMPKSTSMTSTQAGQVRGAGWSSAPLKLECTSFASLCPAREISSRR